MMVYIDDGKPVSMNPIKTPELTAEQRKVIEWATGSEKTLDDPKKKGDFSFSYTFTFDGKRLFLRSYMHLIGIE